MPQPRAVALKARAEKILLEKVEM
ncbi:hypothetical protein DESC_590166 [Desulfosarcina cetonica]|nr:hypothetical protein DESC_590166 [Desulfosarcina cetonica]